METSVQEVEQPVEVKDSVPVVEKPAETKEPLETAEQKAERDAKGRYSKPADERIAEITRKQREAEREAAYWRGRATAGTETKVEAPVAPKPEDFDDYSKYVDALATFKAKQIVGEELTEREKQNEQKRAVSDRQSKFRERLGDGSKEIADYEQVIDSAKDIRVTEHVSEIIEESEIPAKLLYHFAKNPDVLDRLNGMEPKAAAREVGRIEARLEVAKPEVAEVVEETKEAPAPKKTTAPPPPKPLSSGRSTVVDLGKASMDDFIAERKGQKARWAR